MSLDPLPPSIRREVESRVELDPAAIELLRGRSPGTTFFVFLAGVAVGWLVRYWL